jgi:hypothetical protein
MLIQTVLDFRLPGSQEVRVVVQQTKGENRSLTVAAQLRVRLECECMRWFSRAVARIEIVRHGRLERVCSAGSGAVDRWVVLTAVSRSCTSLCRTRCCASGTCPT